MGPMKKPSEVVESQFSPRAGDPRLDSSAIVQRQNALYLEQLQKKQQRPRPARPTASYSRAGARGTPTPAIQQPGAPGGTPADFKVDVHSPSPILGSTPAGNSAGPSTSILFAGSRPVSAKPPANGNRNMMGNNVTASHPHSASQSRPVSAKLAPFDFEHHTPLVYKFGEELETRKMESAQ